MCGLGTERWRGGNRCSASLLSDPCVTVFSQPRCYHLACGEWFTSTERPAFSLWSPCHCLIDRMHAPQLSSLHNRHQNTQIHRTFHYSSRCPSFPVQHVVWKVNFITAWGVYLVLWADKSHPCKAYSSSTCGAHIYFYLVMAVRGQSRKLFFFFLFFPSQWSEWQYQAHR